MLLRMFQRQIQLQCQAVILAAHEMESALTTGDRTRAWVAIQNLLTAAANISKALWGQRAAQRAALRTSLQVDDTSPLKPVVMRNHFEHFDEKLDDWWRDSERHNHVDMSIGPEGMVRGTEEIDMFRQFDPDTGEVMFWSERFNLQEVVAEIQRILPIVNAEAEKPHWEPRITTD